MISRNELEGMNEKLHVYDVVQGAWEQEASGFEVNAHHVLTHLVRDLVGKNFRDSETVQSAIAPDSIQYALRLARWATVRARLLIPASDVNAFLLNKAETALGDLPLNQAAYLEAAGIMARNLHDHDHESSRSRAISARADSMLTAGGYLIYCANVSSEEYNFDLVEAFDARLAYLRERFGIPVPS